MSVVGEVIVERYELEELVGTGGMSSVFKARDRLLERPVALKILHEQYTLDPEYVERFRREARAVAQLAHPNIVTVIDRGEQDGRQFIVFEYVDGENLKQVVNREGALPVRDAVELTIQVARALGFAHERGIVHRDVKPQNVILGDDGRAKVTDFGIARSVDVDGVTQTGTVVGTSDYIAPEQAQGRQVDAQTDVYSLGVVLYELITGDVPYDGENFVAVAMQHVHQPVPSVLDRRPDCPPRLDLVVQRAMAKDPEDRHESMADLVDDLEGSLAAIDGYGGDEAERTLVVPAARRRDGGGSGRAVRRKRRRGPGILIVLALLVLALAGAVYLLVDGVQNRNEGGGGGAAAATNAKLTASAAYDPEGTGGEHDAEVPRATDGNPNTYWTTEDYETGGFTKSGVGIVLESKPAAALSRLTVTTDTPGFPAKIRASNSPSGDFVDVSPEKPVGSTTTFDLDTKDKAYRYYLIWLRLPDGGAAHVNEARAG
jgi:eukaryotic-like serine/threonine-protein kinase